MTHPTWLRCRSPAHGNFLFLLLWSGPCGLNPSALHSLADPTPSDRPGGRARGARSHTVCPWSQAGCLRHSPGTIQPTHLECTDQVVFNIFTALCNHSHCLTLPSHDPWLKLHNHSQSVCIFPIVIQTLDNLASTVCLHVFACPGNLIRVGSYTVWPVVTLLLKHVLRLIRVVACQG